MKNYILKYNQINESNNFEDLSFEEVERLVELGLLNDDLLKIYYYIKNGSIGDLVLINSKLTHLPNWLTKVGGELHISYAMIEDISDSLILSKGIWANYSNLKEFRKTEVFGSLNLDNTQISKLPDNLIVHGYLSVEGIQFEEIPKNLEINESLFIRNSNLKQFSDTELHKMYNITGEISRY
jgi:hypothetical protein